MTDKVKRERKKPASPAATGGAGPQFERRVAAIALARLITGTHFPGVATPLGQVGLQMRVHGYLFDDLVVFGLHETAMPHAAWQIKLTMSVTASDEQFMEVVTAGLHTLSDLCASTSTVVPGVIGVIADGDAEAVDQLRKLHEIADGHSDSSTFDNVFQAGVIDVKVRNRLAEVRKAVEKAITQQAPALGDINASTHALLAALHVWRPATSDNGADYLAALNDLGPLAAELGISAHTLFAHIEDLVQRWALSAGVVRADRVLLRLQMITGLRRTSANVVRDSQAAVLPLDVTAIVLGPVDGHALRPAIAEAETLLEARDPAAAERFAAIAVRFEHAQFWPYANRMRRQQAMALHATGHVEQAITLRADLAWAALDRLQAWDGRFALHDDRQIGDELALTPVANRVWRCADAAVGYSLGEDFDRFAAAFDALEPADPHQLRAAVFLCEEAMAQNQPSQVLGRRNQLETLLGQAPADDAARQLMIRAGMCLADATNGWNAFFAQHRRTVKPLIRAWLHARYARHLALTGDGAQAREHYLDAVCRPRRERKQPRRCRRLAVCTADRGLLVRRIRPARTAPGRAIAASTGHAQPPSRIAARCRVRNAGDE
nr:hypothetical protein GCM10020063_010070 [Dactylosporangium thailandense]